jgi:hypothetical protein
VPADSSDAVDALVDIDGVASAGPDSKLVGLATATELTGGDAGAGTLG